MKTILAFLSVIIALTARPATILQEQEFYAVVFGDSFIGQSFRAEEPYLRSISVGLVALNPQVADTAVHLSLFAGRGTAGSLVAQRSLTPALSLNYMDSAWLDFDMAGVATEPGENYTFIIESPSVYWAAKYNQWAYPSGLNPEYWVGRIDYPGGELFSSSGFSPVLDLTFRVETIPEPGIAVLLLAGLAGLWFWRRLRSSQHR